MGYAPSSCMLVPEGPVRGCSHTVSSTLRQHQAGLVDARTGEETGGGLGAAPRMPAGPSSLGTAPGHSILLPMGCSCPPATPLDPMSSAGVSDGPRMGDVDLRTANKKDLCRCCPPSKGPGGVSEGSPSSVTGVLREEGDAEGSLGGAGARLPCPGSHSGPIRQSIIHPSIH